MVEPAGTRLLAQNIFSCNIFGGPAVPFLVLDAFAPIHLYSLCKMLWQTHFAIDIIGKVSLSRFFLEKQTQHIPLGTYKYKSPDIPDCLISRNGLNSLSYALWLLGNLQSLICSNRRILVVTWLPYALDRAKYNLIEATKIR